MILDLEDPDGGKEKLGQICAIFTVQPKNFEDRQEVNITHIHKNCIKVPDLSSTQLCNYFDTEFIIYVNCTDFYGIVHTFLSAGIWVKLGNSLAWLSPFPRQGFSLSQTRQLIFVAGFAA